MTTFSLRIEISSRCSQRARTELQQIESVWFHWSDVKALQLKGFKYIPMIIYTGDRLQDSPLEYKESFIGSPLSLPLPYYEEIYMLFNSMREKLKVRIVRAIEGRGKRALWPCEILDLKEVQDEINRLASQTLLSKEDPQDMEVAKRLLRWFSHKESTLEENMNRTIETMNWRGKKFGDFFMKALESTRSILKQDSGLISKYYRSESKLMRKRECASMRMLPPVGTAPFTRTLKDFCCLRILCQPSPGSPSAASSTQSSS